MLGLMHQPQGSVVCSLTNVTLRLKLDKHNTIPKHVNALGTHDPVRCSCSGAPLAVALARGTSHGTLHKRCSSCGKPCVSTTCTWAGEWIGQLPIHQSVFVHLCKCHQSNVVDIHRWVQHLAVWLGLSSLVCLSVCNSESMCGHRVSDLHVALVTRLVGH